MSFSLPSSFTSTLKETRAFLNDVKAKQASGYYQLEAAKKEAQSQQPPTSESLQKELTQLMQQWNTLSDDDPQKAQLGEKIAQLQQSLVSTQMQDLISQWTSQLFGGGTGNGLGSGLGGFNNPFSSLFGNLFGSPSGMGNWGNTFNNNWLNPWGNAFGNGSGGTSMGYGSGQWSGLGNDLGYYGNWGNSWGNMGWGGADSSWLWPPQSDMVYNNFR